MIEMKLAKRLPSKKTIASQRRTSLSKESVEIIVRSNDYPGITAQDSRL